MFITLPSGAHLLQSSITADPFPLKTENSKLTFPTLYRSFSFSVSRAAASMP